MSVEFRRIQPAQDLAPFIRHYWVLRGETAGDTLHPVFPDGCAEIVFNLGPSTFEELPSGETKIQPSAMLVGQMTRPVRMRPGAMMSMVGVKLAAWGAAAILGSEAVLLRDRTAGLEELGAASLPVLREQLDECGDDQVAEILNAAMRRRLGMFPIAHLGRLMLFARGLAESPGGSLDSWTRSLGCSPRTLERSFDRWVGISPKELARLLRFQRALRLSSQPGLSWAGIAAHVGYADQAHLGRDFRQFAGASPTAALAGSTAVSTAFVE